MRNNQLFSYARENYKRFINLINKKNYFFRVTLINPGNLILDVQKSAVRELSIVDNVYNPFFSGYITIDNTDNSLERFKSDPSLSEFTDKQTLQSYRVRGDARDILLITILPIEKGKDSYNFYDEEYNRIFGMQIAFLIIDEEEIFSDKYGQVKKFKIIDLDEELLKERKSFFSSVSLIENYTSAQVPYLSDTDKQVPTGKILKTLFQKVLDTNTIYTETVNGVKTTPYFEDGSSKIFYSSPSGNTAMNDIAFIYGLHVSGGSNKDFSFLNKDQYTGEYTLESASNYYKKSYDKKSDNGGPYFIENFTITGGQDVKSVLQNDLKKPAYALEFGENSDIIEAKFFNSSGKLFQEKIKSVLVHSYYFSGKEFKVDCSSGNIENVKKDFTQLYVKPMKGKTQPAPNLIINNSQRTNINYDEEFTVFNQDDDFIKLSLGRNRLLKDAIKLNLGVELTVQGGLQRQAGKFFSIDRKGSYIENDFDNKFLGIYFILNVEHLFENNDKFTDRIIAVKTYSFVDLKNNENVL